MSRVSFSVAGVLGKPRPRFFRRPDGSVGTYTEKHAAMYEKAVGAAYKAAGGTLNEGAVSVSIAYRTKAPKALRGRQWDLTKPDVDNVAKIVLDGLNSVAYEDDKQVVSLSVSKMPRVEGSRDEELRVTVAPMGDEDMRGAEVLWQLFTN